MPHIHVIYSGGTIGMTESPQGRQPAGDLLPRLQAAAGQRLDRLADQGITWELTPLAPLIDSAEASPTTWRALAHAVLRASVSADGVVLLHGTDTLAPSGAALSFALRGLGKPVVLTGAQNPLGDAQGHAADNVLLALQAAAEPPLRNEVVLAFGGQLLRANRCLKWSTRAAEAFISPNWPALGGAQADGDLRLNPAALLPPNAVAPTPTGLPMVPERLPSIGLLRLHPGIDIARWQAWLAVRPLDGLVLHTYGSGNAPVTSTALVALVERCVAQGTVVVNVTQCPHGSVDLHAYASASPLSAVGVIGAADMTADCALAKLDWLFGCLPPEARAAQFVTALCGEATLAP
jgi:L-asparaginase